MTNRLYSILFALTCLLSGCSGCSRSGRRAQLLRSQQYKEKVTDRNPQIKRESLDTSFKTPVSTSEQSAIIKMQKVNDVYQIPVKIDGVPMFFIFDTGAGMISISMLEASFLYKQGKLSDDDIVGNANFVDANGNISEGTIIILRSVMIGSRQLNNVQASVVKNLNAPLLFGQSALERFGKISIDYQHEEITFE